MQIEPGNCRVTGFKRSYHRESNLQSTESTKEKPEKLFVSNLMGFNVISVHWRKGKNPLNPEKLLK